MSNRRKVPDDIQSQLKVLNKFVCCVCRDPRSAHELQIHHIDGDASNNVLGNLALLCYRDHDLANLGLKPGAMGQGRKMTRSDVRSFKHQWEKAVANQLKAVQNESLAVRKQLGHDPTVTEIVARVQSKTTPLSGCVAEALGLAVAAQCATLERFCRLELAGWSRKELREVMGADSKYRVVRAIASPNLVPSQELLSRLGVERLFATMKADRSQFVELDWPILEPLSVVESNQHANPSEGILTYHYRWQDLDRNSETPDNPAYIFVRATDYSAILEFVKMELTRRLLDLLPKHDS